MKPDFKTIDIARDAFGDKHAPLPKGEDWLTPEMIPVKPVYTKDDLEGLEHLDYVAGLPPFLRGPYSAMYPMRPGQFASMPVSRPQKNRTLSTAATLLRDRKAFRLPSTSLHTVATTPTMSAL